MLNLMAQYLKLSSQKTPNINHSGRMEIVFGLKGENAEPLLLQKKKEKSFCNLSDVHFYYTAPTLIHCNDLEYPKTYSHLTNISC